MIGKIHKKPRDTESIGSPCSSKPNFDCARARTFLGVQRNYCTCQQNNLSVLSVVWRLRQTSAVLDLCLFDWTVLTAEWWGGLYTHLIDCWVRFVQERWTEYERRNKVAVCPALSWKKSRQNDTGNSHPTEEKKRGKQNGHKRRKHNEKMRGEDMRACQKQVKPS